eukprot:1671428-Amphidinium_carterae.1
MLGFVVGVTAAAAAQATASPDTSTIAREFSTAAVQPGTFATTVLPFPQHHLDSEDESQEPGHPQTPPFQQRETIQAWDIQ